MTQLRAILTFMALISLSACQPPANLDYERGTKYGLSSLTMVNAKEWVVNCRWRAVSTTGEVRGRDLCTLNRGGGGITGIVEWHPSGPTLARHNYDQLCNGGNVAYGVDGQSLRGMSFRSQYAVLSQGRLYASDTRSNFPECATNTLYYSLDGFAEGFEELRQRAIKREFALSGF
jgi:hypothetical protein